MNNNVKSNYNNIYNINKNSISSTNNMNYEKLIS